MPIRGFDVGAENRRHERYDIELPVVVWVGHEAHNMLIRNVSFEGAFIEADQVPPVQRFIQLEVFLPGETDSLRVPGTAVYHRSEGFGVRFFCLQPEARRRWNEFILLVRDATGETSDVVPLARRPKPAPAQGADRPVISASVPELRVALDSEEQVQAVRGYILDDREMLVETNINLALGASIWLTLVAPATAHSISILAEVRGVYAEPKFSGLALKCRVEETDRIGLDEFASAYVAVDCGDKMLMLSSGLETRSRAPLVLPKAS